MHSLFIDWNFERHLQSGVDRNRTIEQIVESDSLLNEMDDWLSKAPIYDLIRQALAR